MTGSRCSRSMNAESHMERRFGFNRAMREQKTRWPRPAVLGASKKIEALKACVPRLR